MLEQVQSEGDIPAIEIAAALASMVQGSTPLFLAAKPESEQQKAPPRIDGSVPTQTYRIERAWIVNPDDVSVLDPTPGQSITLVTCYPFYFVGSAPERFIVRAHRIPEQEESEEWIVDVDME